jgi:hypothetical protein
MGMENGESKKYSEMIGTRYGRLLVESVKRVNNRNVCACLCDCGTRKDVRRDHLIGGKIVSCGCYQKEVASNVSATHGMTHIRLYRCWRNMKTRCYNPNYIEFDRYGGRGIVVCEEWQRFEPFYEWAISHGYQNDLTLDRKNNDGNYCPENCKWSDTQEQALNRSSNSFVTYNGITKHISEWDKDVGAAKSGRVRARLNAGWSVESAVTTPVKRSGQPRL